MTTAVLGSFLGDIAHQQVVTYATGLPASAELYLKGAAAFTGTPSHHFPGYPFPAASLADTTGQAHLSGFYDATSGMLPMHANPASLAGHHLIADPTQHMMAAVPPTSTEQLTMSAMTQQQLEQVPFI